MYEYSFINLYNSSFSPSTVHVANTSLQQYFVRYLLQKWISVYKADLPEGWNMNYFMFTLFIRGHIAVIETDKFGVIPQDCTLTGYDVQYQPTHVLISNPHLRGYLMPRIGEQCTLIRLMPDYAGIMDKVYFYADQMALAAESIGINFMNTHTGIIFPAANKAQAEAYKKMYDRVAGGEPAVVIGKELFSEIDGELKPTWAPFVQNLQQQYIVDKLVNDLRSIENDFCTEIGIPNANLQKKERMNTMEVNRNSIEVYSVAGQCLELMRDGCRQARDMFGIDLDMNWRYQPEEVGINEQTGTSVNSGAGTLES